eukprot:scaffold1638_cov120-Cylindrotheca_fusiformis.AAC.12
MELNNLEPKLVHQILLTDPSDLDSLGTTLKSRTQTFQEFQENLLHGNSNPTFMLKRAFHDNTRKRIEETQDLEPLKHLLLELHGAIRALVPNRTDLHSFLKDDIELSTEENSLSMLPWISRAAQALENLESEVRAQSTTEWISIARSASTIDDQLSFVIVSLFYLIDKAELCNQDKKDFYLTQFVAPRIRNTDEGPSMERKAMHNKFGERPPITEQWIKSLISSSDDRSDALLENPQERRDLIRKGWIEDIVFQKDKEIVLPEVFYLDLAALQAIRNSTRLAAAGCALGYFACVAANVDPEVLLKEEERGKTLVQVMSNKMHPSIEAYERSVEDCVVSLAQEWAATGHSLDDKATDTLKSQTRSVLKGQSPVIKLLDGRMREVFTTTVLKDIEPGLPSELHSGVQQNAVSKSKKSAFVSNTRKQFQQRGLAFYSLELAQTAELAARVANLACDLYMDDFLDRMILDCLNSSI